MSHEIGHIAEEDLVRGKGMGKAVKRWRDGLSEDDLLMNSRQAMESTEIQALAEAFAMAQHTPRDDWSPSVKRLMELMRNAGTR